MERNRIVDVKILSLCKYAEKIGLQYFPRFEINQFSVKQYTMHRGHIRQTVFRLSIKRTYAPKVVNYIMSEIKKFYDLHVDNPHIDMLGFNIEEGALKTYVNLILSYKAPDIGEVELFVECVKHYVEGLELKWDRSIPMTAATMISFNIESVNDQGYWKRYCNPLNTAQHGFYRGDDITGFYFDPSYGMLTKLLHKAPGSSFYIDREPIQNGHSILTLLTKS